MQNEDEINKRIEQLKKRLENFYFNAEDCRTIIPMMEVVIAELKWVLGDTGYQKYPYLAYWKVSYLPHLTYDMSDLPPLGLFTPICPACLADRGLLALYLNHQYIYNSLQYELNAEA